DKQSKSSLTIQTYCDRHKLSSGMFYYWKRKLNGLSSREQFSEVQIVNQESLSCTIHVRFPSGVEMWLDTGTEASFLRELARC
ncbi:MAG: hypothetical protein SGI87_12670, partial [Flavobacteriales bacterium]|nr:hypothetical protein [Flavobacteriales bacterium]